MKKQTRKDITIFIGMLLAGLIFGMLMSPFLKEEEEAYSRFIQEHIEMRENGKREALGY